MTAQTSDLNDARLVKRSPARTPHPPGVAVGIAVWIIYWGSMIGLALDAMFAVSVVNKAFRIPPLQSTLIVSVIGLIAAKITTSAALSWNSGKRVMTVFALAAPISVGLMLAWARTVYGTVARTGTDFATASTVATNSHPEAPATAVMLTLYGASVIGVFGTALKLFHPARTQLKHHRKELKRILKELTPMEADLVAIEERLNHGELRKQEQEQAHIKALEQLAEREAQLKAYARDAIARAVGDPAATPLVRAPHEPKPTDQFNRLHPVN